MRNNYLLDTNILIYYFNGILDDVRMENILQTSFNISIITKIEFLSWQKLRDDKILEKKANDFIKHATIFELSDKIADEVINIRQNYKIKTPDAIIGATALIHGLNLVTNNLDDFKHLDVELLSIDLKKETS